MSRRWHHLETDLEWGREAPSSARAPLPDLDETQRPVAGRILGPDGDVIRVVRYGPERLPFGPQARGERG